MRVRIRRFSKRQDTDTLPVLEPLLAVGVENGSALWLFGSGFTLPALPAVSLCKTVGFPRSFYALPAPGTFAVQPFPMKPTTLGTMASADSCRLSLVSRRELQLPAWRQVSPDKNVDLLRTLARFTALPFDGMDFVIKGPLVRARSLLSGLCSSSRGFASGFLQTSPRGDALASG